MPDQAVDGEAGTCTVAPSSSGARASGDPRLQDVLDALDDPDCRTLLAHMDDPLTADELSAATGIPRSTTYRKLDLLADASLVDERVDVSTDGNNVTRYVVGFDEVHVALDDDRSLDLELVKPARTPDERLSTVWSEVRKET